jgi:hypothetical protein
MSRTLPDRAAREDQLSRGKKSSVTQTTSAAAISVFLEPFPEQQRFESRIAARQGPGHENDRGDQPAEQPEARELRGENKSQEQDEAGEHDVRRAEDGVSTQIVRTASMVPIMPSTTRR